MSEKSIDTTITPAGEIKTAVQELVKAFEGFQNRMEQKVRLHEDRLAMIDRKSASRPALAQAADDHAPHRKAVSAYIRSGDDSGLRGLAVELKGMTTHVPGDGGVLVDGQTAAQIESVRRSSATLRTVANVVSVQAASYDMLIETGAVESVWMTESGEVPETSAGVFERVSIPLHELSAMPRASQRLLEDSAFDVEAWLAGAIAERFARAENEAFVNGTGAAMPRGFLSHPQAPAATAGWGEIGYVASGVSGGLGLEDPSDSLVDLVYALGARYRARGTFVMNSRTAGLIRKLKDTDGRFLWSECLSAGEPSRLMGYPVLTCEEMPDIAADATPIAFGDFEAGYTIVERPDVRILRDPYSAKPHVQFYATARVGGDVSDFSAIRLLKLSAA